MANRGIAAYYKEKWVYGNHILELQHAVPFEQNMLFLLRRSHLFSEMLVKSLFTLRQKIAYYKSVF